MHRRIARCNENVGSRTGVHICEERGVSDLQLQLPCNDVEARHVFCNPMLHLKSCVHLQ